MAQLVCQGKQNFLTKYPTIYLPKWKFECILILSKEEGKDQESIQSSTTPDPGH